MKNAKILYLDLRCPIGHINFNNIYLNAFLSKGVELDIVLPRTYMSKLSLMKTGYKYYEVPSSLESNNRSSLKNRLAILKYHLIILQLFFHFFQDIRCLCVTIIYLSHTLIIYIDLL